MFALLKRIFSTKPRARQRRVNKINAADYPKEKYSAYWQIVVDGDDEVGYAWRVDILARNATRWEYKGRILDSLDGVDIIPSPVAPHDATPAQMKEFFKELNAVKAANPQPLLLLEQKHGAEMARNKADKAAQLWVKERMKHYRILP